MKTLAIDIETFSDVDLAKSGVYAYSASPRFEVLLFGYSIDGGPVEVVDLASGEQLPDHVRVALRDPDVIKTAWNAQFERVCLARWLDRSADRPSEVLPPEQWRCSMVHAYYAGLPPSLAGAARALKLDAQKDASGSRLIRYFCTPAAPSLLSQGGRNLPESDPEGWAQFVEYCRQDVAVELEARKVLDRHPMPERERAIYALDQRINDTGFAVDEELVRRAIECDEHFGEHLTERAKKVTGLSNPRSVPQLKRWVEERLGSTLPSLDKAAVLSLLDTTTDATVLEALELRLQLGKSSVAKFRAYERSTEADGRARGVLQYYGSSRAGRWAGRRIQPQNLARVRMGFDDLLAARELVKAGEFDDLEFFYDDVLDVLSQLTRTAITASPGCYLACADFSAIEARVLAWLAGESWVLEVFRGDGRIYEATAAQMFRVPVDTIERGSPEREKGKVATLACGYQGGVNALVQMGALRAGIAESDLQGIVDAWRESNPAIVQFWADCNTAAITAVRERRRVELGRWLAFECTDGTLRIWLPSGRSLNYVDPLISRDPTFGRDGLTYMGLNEQNKWVRQRTYGGKLVENITQGVARDCLAETLLRIQAAALPPIVLHVHDEVVLDCPEGWPEDDARRAIVELMSEPMPWAPGLPLTADVYTTPFFRTD